VVQQLEDMASHLDDLKQQQAQAMAAAAAPLFHPAHGSQQDSDPGHELTPSMMAELMPSGFGPGSGPSDIEEEAQGSGVLYEMSRISGGSNDRGAVLDLHSDGDADAAVVEEGGLGGLALPRPRLLAGLFGAAPCAGEAGAAEGRVEGSHSRSGSKHSRVAVVQLG
jgi:hypothetical protein